MALTISAQDDDSMPQPVMIEAADGLMLVGDFYLLNVEEPAPAVLLLHMLGSERGAWDHLIPELTASNYNVLAIDMRGHGDTGGDTNWGAAEGDLQTLLDWLREQNSVQDEAIAIVGASIGSNLALIGCANDADCVTAVALSPGLDYRGVMPEEAVTGGLSERSVLLIATHGDDESAEAVKQMLTNSHEGEITVELHSGSLHGTDMFVVPRLRERVFASILHWLDIHLNAD
ncbi:alpha/beta fold hydrolase [bacterium]|nr:alpha/beta fold hydrolase [bacterium]